VALGERLEGNLMPLPDELGQALVRLSRENAQGETRAHDCWFVRKGKCRAESSATLDAVGGKTFCPSTNVEGPALAGEAALAARLLPNRARWFLEGEHDLLPDGPGGADLQLGLAHDGWRHQVCGGAAFLGRVLVAAAVIAPLILILRLGPIRVRC